MDSGPEKTSLQVLIVDDSPDDEALIVHILRRAGLKPTFLRVQTAPDMREALEQRDWEIILCDFTMPTFDSYRALETLAASGKQIPMLVVSSAIGEERSAELMRAGAADVLLKGNMHARLIPTIRRELAAAEARRRAAESEQRFKDVAELAGNWIWETGPDHRFTFMTGDGPRPVSLLNDAALGKARWELAGVDPADDIWVRHRATLDGHQAFRDFQYTVRSPTGELSYVQVSGKPIFDKSGRFKGFRGSGLDITGMMEARLRLETAEAQLVQAQKMESIGQLTGGLAHDFNNLLLVVIANLEMLLDERPDDPKVLEFAAEARDAAQRGGELTRSMLAFARRQPLRPERIDVNGLVGEIAKLLSRTLGERIDVKLEFGEAIWATSVDAAQLQSSIANLATNARDAMPKGGRLTIRTSNQVLDDDYASRHDGVLPGEYVMIDVRDSGSGMSPEILARVFEPFFTTKRRTEGTGLGLSMVFGFVKQSGGHIAVTSQIGVGTEFRIYLPRDRRRDDRIKVQASQSATHGKGETILVVEDDERIRRMVVRVLTTRGYQVRQAEDAACAIRLLEGDSEIDLLFTDILMAGEIDGYDLARIVTDRWPRTQIVFTSGFPDKEMDRVSDLPSTIPLLTKPYSVENLTRVLHQALAQHPV